MGAKVIGRHLELNSVSAATIWAITDKARTTLEKGTNGSRESAAKVVTVEKKAKKYNCQPTDQKVTTGREQE